jgi:hypothetical protein
MRRVKLSSGEIRRFARHTGSLGKLKPYGKIALDFTWRDRDNAGENARISSGSKSRDLNQYNSAALSLIVNIDAGCGA